MPRYDLPTFARNSYEEYGYSSKKLTPTQLVKYKKKVTRCDTALGKLRKLINNLNQFIYNVKQKPSDIILVEKGIVAATKKVPKFTSIERQRHIADEYLMVKKHFICPICTKDLLGLKVDNQDINISIVCNDCGIMYRNPAKIKKGKKKKVITSEMLFGPPDEDYDPSESPYLDEDGCECPPETEPIRVHSPEEQVEVAPLREPTPFGEVVQEYVRTTNIDSGSGTGWGGSISSSSSGSN